MTETEKSTLLNTAWSLQLDLFKKLKALCKEKSREGRTRLCGEISAINGTMGIIGEKLSQNPPQK